MFKKLKDMLFGSKEAVVETPEVIEQPKVTEPVPAEEPAKKPAAKKPRKRKEPIKVKETVKPVVVKAPAKKTTTSKGKHTKASLSELNKKDLLELAKLEFKLDLNQRDKKDVLIKAIITAQGK